MIFIAAFLANYGPGFLAAGFYLLLAFFALLVLDFARAVFYRIGLSVLDLRRRWLEQE